MSNDNKLSDLAERHGFEIRDAPETVNPAKPFIITSAGPLWFQNVDLKELQLQNDLGWVNRRELLNMMVWNKALSMQQTTASYKNLNATSDGLPRANMIGLYEQMFNNNTPEGAFARIQDGDIGPVFLLRSGNMFSVFSDSIGAAKRFCLSWLYKSNMKAAYESAGMPDDFQRLVSELST